MILETLCQPVELIHRSEDLSPPPNVTLSAPTPTAIHSMPTCVVGTRWPRRRPASDAKSESKEAPVGRRRLRFLVGASASVLAVPIALFASSAAALGSSFVVTPGASAPGSRLGGVGALA